MKTYINIKVLFFLLITILLATSCKKDSINDDDNNPEEFTSCMSHKDLHDVVKKATYIFFLNENEGWVIGHSEVDPNAGTGSGNVILLHTHDGGNSWSVINDNMDLNFNDLYKNQSPFKLFFINSTDGYMRKDYNSITMSRNTTPFLYTTDKGVTWQSISAPTDLNENGFPDYYGFGYNDTQMVFAAETQLEGESTSHHRLYFVPHSSHTISSKIEMSDGVYLHNTHDIHYTNSGAINLLNINNNGDHVRAYSSNNGASWTYTNVMEGAYIARYFSEFPSDNVGYIPVHDNASTAYYYKTTNGGETWVKKTVETEYNSQFQRFAFADENNGLAYASSNLYKTTNGGDTWELVTCYNSDGSAYFVKKIYPKELSYPAVNKGFVLSNYQDVNADTNDFNQNRMYFYTGE